MTAQIILPGSAEGPILAADEPLSFWGGIDPASGTVIDIHHPLHGRCVTGAILMLPSTRGSCTGSGVLLDLILTGRGPAALIFSQPEDVVTLGAMVAAEMFDRPLPILRLAEEGWQALAARPDATITASALTAGNLDLPLDSPPDQALALSDRDRAMLDGREGKAAQIAMRIIRATAINQGADRLIDVTQGHIDGCIYASPANLTFAETMAATGAKVCIPTTMNAISVDHANWRAQGVPDLFGGPAQRLADAYVRMGCKPTFTCSPYLLDSAPAEGEAIAWSESNAVIYANSVIGARTARHPDFLDLCIALTGRAPLAGVYLDQHRVATRIIDFDLPDGFDDAVWPLIGYLAGKASPDRIPLLCGLAGAQPAPEALKALCAAFGTTSAAPMLHVGGVTPEAGRGSPLADRVRLTVDDLRAGWQALNQGDSTIDLVAIGSPHASLAEMQAFADALGGATVTVPAIVTAGRQVIADATAKGVVDRLQASGVQILPDLCWCSISQPVFPPATRTLMTNSGKYAHYGPALTGCAVRFGSLAACADAARTGLAPKALPPWLSDAIGDPQ
jgi:predicted aconitase/predicted aconitase with swiveling domain